MDHNVLRLLKQRYFISDNDTWEILTKEVVEHVARDETPSYKERVHTQIYNRVWLPNSPCLVGARSRNGGMIACFVVGPCEDTLENHVEVLGDIAAVGKRGGGCGFTGTFIRAEGSKVNGSAHGYAYGPNKWAIRVSDYLDMITQGGFRKMALMYTLKSDHNDIEKFIDLKQNRGETFAYNFNQSVMATDNFMRKACIPGTREEFLLNKIAHNAWNNGDPGLLFFDTINRNTPYAATGTEINATNPCGEQPLPPYLACVLGSININHETFWREEAIFDWDYLSAVAMDATVFLNDVGEKNVFPNEKFKTEYEKYRPIGLGIMGYADALLRMELAYGSGQALSFLERIMRAIYEAADLQSRKLGQVRGIPEKCNYVQRRNITLTTIAPTGSIGFLAECSHAIEPIFSPIYNRIDERGENYLFSHPLRGEPYFRSSINDDPLKIVSPTAHLDTQACAQKWVDSGVSKTVNLPHSATVDDVKQVMFRAWEMGCKGVTVYRDGSRQFQVLNNLKEEDQETLDCPDGICEI